MSTRDSAMVYPLFKLHFIINLDGGTTRLINEKYFSRNSQLESRPTIILRLRNEGSEPFGKYSMRRVEERLCGVVIQVGSHLMEDNTRKVDQCRRKMRWYKRLRER